jgi:exopolysaccharide biosynthesis polyprenyl glycosylphosphotransferase
MSANTASVRRVLLVGNGETLQDTLDKLNDFEWRGVHVIGYLSDSKAQHTKFDYCGPLESIEDAILHLKIDDVLLALPADARLETQQLIGRIMSKPCNVWVVPDYFKVLLASARADRLGDVPLLALTKPVLTPAQRALKRTFDIVAAIVLLPFALPIMALLALAIKLDSPGPVLFRQQRVGEHGNLFTILKFRSMFANASQAPTLVKADDPSMEGYNKSPDDPRVTRIGKFIRRTSLDELPNLFNVLMGEMSLVGPRPELPYFVNRYQAWQYRRLIVPQGMTGWWQINGRSDKPMHLHTEDDIYYVQNYSFWLDLKILIKTALVVFRGSGAY